MENNFTESAKDAIKQIPLQYRIGIPFIILLVVTIGAFFARIPKAPQEMNIVEQITKLEKESGNELVMQITLKKNVDTANSVLEKAQNAVSGATAAYQESVQRVMDNDAKRNQLREQLYSVINNNGNSTEK